MPVWTLFHSVEEITCIVSLQITVFLFKVIEYNYLSNIYWTCNSFYQAVSDSKPNDFAKFVQNCLVGKVLSVKAKVMVQMLTRTLFHSICEITHMVK